MITRVSVSGTAANASAVVRRCFLPMPPLSTKTCLANPSTAAEKLEMLFPSCEQQRRPACFQGTPQVCGDQGVSCRILHQRGVDILNRQVCHLGRHPEIGVPRDHLV